MTSKLRLALVCLLASPLSWSCGTPGTQANPGIGGMMGAGAAGMGGTAGIGGVAGVTGVGGTAGTGVGGSAGLSGGVGGMGGSVQRVEPMLQGDNYVLEFGDLAFEVSPGEGGRITRFSYAGQNVLTDLFQDAEGWLNGGSTFWTSPQADWGWPPLSSIDSDDYQATIDATEPALVLTSGSIDLTDGTITVAKRFSADAANETIRIRYTVTCQSGSVRLAAWEISRVPANGVTFFAGSGVMPLGELPEPSWVDNGDGVVWLDHGAQGVQAKLGASSSQGYIAYATPNVLFGKRFADTPPGSAAEGEAGIEWYVRPGQYVEIEQQGPVTSLSQGQSLSYDVTWSLHAIDAGINVSPGSATLLAFAKSALSVP